MDDLKRYLGLILACGTLALFLAGPAMVQAEGIEEDGQLGTEDWALECLGDIYKKNVPEEDCGYCNKVAGGNLVVLFNIDMGRGQSYGGSVFEFRRQTQVGNNSPTDNFIIRSVDNFDNLSARRQMGNTNTAAVGQFGP